MKSKKEKNYNFNEREREISSFFRRHIGFFSTTKREREKKYLTIYLYIYIRSLSLPFKYNTMYFSARSLSLCPAKSLKTGAPAHQVA